MGLILRSLVTFLFVTYAHGLVFKFPSEDPCIMAEMDVNFTLSYDKEFKNLLDPQLETSKSTCGNESVATLALYWKDKNDTMTFTFIKGSKKVEVHMVYGFTPSTHFPDTKDSNLTEMVSPKEGLSMSNMSFKCVSPLSIKFIKNMYQLVMTVVNLQVQAFGVKNGSFSNYEECSEDTLTTGNPPPETTTHHSLTTTGPQTTISPPSEYTYKYPDSNTCIMLQSAIQLHFNFMDKQNATVTAKVNVPSPFEVTATGHCAVNSTDDAFIMLYWKLKTSSIFSLKMYFKEDKNAKLYKMEVNGVLSQEGFPSLPVKSINVTSIANGSMFESAKLTYYKCNSPEEVKLDNITIVVIDKIQVQAFGVKDSSFTGKGTECSQDHSTENPTTVTTPMHSTEKTTTEQTHSTMTKQTHSTMTKQTHSTMTEQTHSTMTSKETTATSAQISTTAVTPHPTNNYSVHDGGVTCVYFVAELDFTFQYTAKNGTNMTVVISVPQKFEVNGTCNTHNETTNTLDIYFYDSWMLAFVFGPDNSSSQLGDMPFKTYSVKSITLEYKMDHTLFPGYNDSDTSMHQAVANITGLLFQSQVNGSYKCNADLSVSFSGNVNLKTKNLQYKAFNQDNSTNFGGVLSECSQDNSNDNNKTNSVVPIAVGAALAGLVVIVLIAYLIGRRRNRKGYESV